MADPHVNKYGVGEHSILEQTLYARILLTILIFCITRNLKTHQPSNCSSKANVMHSSLSKANKEVPFTNLSASGNGEVYDISDAKKFVEFGWRCSTNETGFKSQTLIGNWNEERYDIKYLAKKKPIPSQYNHYFQTTHKKCYTRSKPIENLPSYVKLLGGLQCEPRTFPRHQPELDPEAFKHHYNKFESTSMAAYKDPRK